MTQTHSNRATRDIEVQLQEAFGGLDYQSRIPHGVRVEEAHAWHRTVLEFAPASTPAKAYESLVSEVLGDEHERQPLPRGADLRDRAV